METFLVKPKSYRDASTATLRNSPFVIHCKAIKKKYSPSTASSNSPRCDRKNTSSI